MTREHAVADNAQADFLDVQAEAVADAEAAVVSVVDGDVAATKTMIGQRDRSVLLWQTREASNDERPFAANDAANGPSNRENFRALVSRVSDLVHLLYWAFTGIRFVCESGPLGK